MVGYLILRILSWLITLPVTLLYLAMLWLHWDWLFSQWTSFYERGVDLTMLVLNSAVFLTVIFSRMKRLPDTIVPLAAAIVATLSTALLLLKSDPAFDAPETLTGFVLLMVFIGFLWLDHWASDSMAERQLAFLENPLTPRRGS